MIGINHAEVEQLFLKKGIDDDKLLSAGEVKEIVKEIILINNAAIEKKLADAMAKIFGIPQNPEH
ncbi:hypothetical protein H1S01_12750 [Heliobacterium chlorum]|uniref:Uncharacterized protein n=1 Tax=Heliobacterium chlorum TaxID=2698 RepID=A0ABR7T5M0_HELCL|nr:hypothetical protein [Heliobacterium chlorum]MBC9785377.1 hypothetical protein [Heliobacterium chlorum]